MPRMHTSKFAIAIGVLMFLSGCSFSVTTANISSLKLGKDKAVAQEVRTFAPGDTIYGVATIANNISKIGVKGRLVIESVEGQTPGPIPGLETVVNLESSGTATFTFSPPTAGWPAGKYKLEVLMIDDTGKQQDQETADFSVS